MKIAYGGIEFKHVWKFLIKIMVGNQYDQIVNAESADDVIKACLRLGWNDAFRHTSKNVDGIKEAEKAQIIMGVCDAITTEFKEYAKKETPEERHEYINDRLEDKKFKEKFACIKIVDDDNDKSLCFGHIQKMFNMAIKLFLCLKICAEQADDMKIDIGLDTSLFECDFAFDTADCPLDSIILGTLSTCSNIKWSKLGHEGHPSSEYINAQKAIREKLNDDSKSNLYYDFENWI